MTDRRLTNDEHAVLKAAATNQENGWLVARRLGVNFVTFAARAVEFGWMWEKPDHRIVVTKKGRKRLERPADIIMMGTLDVMRAIQVEKIRREQERAERWLAEEEQL